MGPFSCPKNQSMALPVDVAELMELFKYSNDGFIKNKWLQRRVIIEQRIIDILNYLMEVADKLYSDLKRASLKKTLKNIL